MDKTAELTSLLQARYAQQGRRQEWIFLTNVRDTTGRPKGSKRRYADGVAMNLWPSKGLALHGFEIKVSRSDFLSELRDPDKANEIKRYCDYWWLVIHSKDIIDLGGVPKDWGVMCASCTVVGGLEVVKRAPKLKSEPLSRGMVASLLRNAALGK